MSPVNNQERATKIAALNDHFRHWGIVLLLAGRPDHSRRLGKTILTRAVADLGPFAVWDILRLVATFNAFTEDNDPHGEHDFGSVDHESRRLFWKIDYYAPDLQDGSEDPSDPMNTIRVLTIMLAEEF